MKPETSPELLHKSLLHLQNDHPSPYVLFSGYLDMEGHLIEPEPEGEPVVIRSRAKTRALEGGSRPNERVVGGVDFSCSQQSPETTPGIEGKSSLAVRALLVPVKQQEHLGLISTTYAQIISYTISDSFN